MAADKKIEDLDNSGTLTGSEFLVLSQSSLTVKSALSGLLTYLGIYFTGGTAIVTTGLIATGTWNSRIKKRIRTTGSTGSVNTNADTDDGVYLTILSTNVTFVNPTGTPNEGQELSYRIKSDSTPRIISFGADFRFSSSLPNPAITSSDATIYFWFEWNAIDSKWDCVRILDSF